MTIIYFLIILAVIIFVHELGHMLAAKLFGCYVSEFAIGFGPTVFKKVGKETTYSLRAIPLGGFTGMVEKENTPIKFDEEGISKLAELFDTDLDSMEQRVKAITDAGKAYKSFSISAEDEEADAAEGLAS